MLRALAIPWGYRLRRGSVRRRKAPGTIPSHFRPALEGFITDLEPGIRRRVMDQDMFAEERELGAQHGIFTLAIVLEKAKLK